MLKKKKKVKEGKVGRVKGEERKGVGDEEVWNGMNGGYMEVEEGYRGVDSKEKSVEVGEEK